MSAVCPPSNAQRLRELIRAWDQEVFTVLMGEDDTVQSAPKAERAREIMRVSPRETCEVKLRLDHLEKTLHHTQDLLALLAM